VYKRVGKIGLSKKYCDKDIRQTKRTIAISFSIHFDGIAILLLPFGLLHKFVIVFVAPYFFARETPVSEKKLYLHSLTHTSLWLGYVPARLLYFIKGMTFISQSHARPFHLIHTSYSYSLHHAPVRMAV
jgi:hypothetical protein